MSRSPIRQRAIAAALLLFALMLAAPISAADEPVWPPITEPSTSQYVHGRWVWEELFTENTSIAADFYGRLLGWSFQVKPAGRGPAYTLALLDGEPVGGMIERDHSYEQQRGSRWIGMISVPDVKAAARYAVKQGGKVVVAPRVLQGRGEVALLIDPEGAPFGVIHSSSGYPPDFLAEDGQWVWVELWAKVLARWRNSTPALPATKSKPWQRQTGVRDTRCPRVAIFAAVSLLRLRLQFHLRGCPTSG